MSCFLCDELGGTVLWQDEFCRVVRADEPDYPGFLRVILNAHIKEMTDLPTADQQAMMRVVFATEASRNWHLEKAAILPKEPAGFPAQEAPRASAASSTRGTSWARQIASMRP